MLYIIGVYFNIKAQRKRNLWNQVMESLRKAKKASLALNLAHVKDKNLTVAVRFGMILTGLH